jgi:hypothetical protein
MLASRYIGTYNRSKLRYSPAFPHIMNKDMFIVAAVIVQHLKKGSAKHHPLYKRDINGTNNTILSRDGNRIKGATE